MSHDPQAISGGRNEATIADETAEESAAVAAGHGGYDTWAAFDEADKRRMRRLAAVPIVFLLAAYAGQLSFAALLARAPLLLLSLNATDPILLGVAHQAPLWAFMAIGVTRLFITDPFLYWLGYDYGPNAKAYLAAELGPRNRIIRTMGWVERWFGRVGWLALYAIPGYPMCLLAGIARMRLWAFVVVNLAGTITRLALVWWVADLFSGPLGTFVAYVNRYSIPLTVAMFVIVALQTARNQHRAANAERAAAADDADQPPAPPPTGTGLSGSGLSGSGSPGSGSSGSGSSGSGSGCGAAGSAPVAPPESQPEIARPEGA